MHIQEIASKLLPFNTDIKESEEAAKKAAVLVLLNPVNSGYEVLLTERASHLRQHAGEIAFPGGGYEAGERFPVDTALREAQEEVAIGSTSVEVLGLLPKAYPRSATEVTPVVAMTSNRLHLVLDRNEVASAFWLPISFLLDDKRKRTDVFHRGGDSLWAPAYEYQGHEIWGFTAGVLKQLVNRCFDAGLTQLHEAPERVWR